MRTALLFLTTLALLAGPAPASRAAEDDEIHVALRGQKLVAARDISIPANRQSVFFGQLDSVPFIYPMASKSCELRMRARSPSDRVIPAGAVLSVASTGIGNISEIYDGSYFNPVMIRVDHPEIAFLKCARVGKHLQFQTLAEFRALMAETLRP
jgi:hypothetical protein